MLILEDEILIISANAIAKINEDLIGCKIQDNRYKSCLSSYFYYDSKYEQIASIVRSLIKDHYFPDANKRTAFCVFMVLCRINNIKVDKSDNELINLFVNIAENNYDVSYITELLFN